MKSSFKRYVIGKPLKSEALGEQKLSKTKALAILSSDALSSVAYGPEQILLVLMTVSTVAFWYSLPIAVGVVVLLIALILSYRQVIFAYPHGGGAYVVSRENLGVNAGLVAGGSLLVDYILTVAVSVSAGTDAITSAFPSLHAHNVAIAIFFVICLTLLNLRGVTESASILAYPVYLFVVVMLVLIGVGVYNVVTGQVPDTLHAPIGTPVTGISLFILLKAFASGSSALTGVEAISNAIPNFKDPAPKNASKTLLAMGGILAILFVGIVLLAYFYGIVPNSKETVVSQIAEASVGRNMFYYIIQGTTAMILVLAANTGYSAFPLLAVNLSKDGFIPRIFQVRGDRLGYSNGIVMLGIAAIMLIVLFDGATEHLIPLYAVGVFIPFTLAQVGMVRKWWYDKSDGWIGKLAINLLGAVISFIVAMMFLVTKLPQVWPVFIFVPLIILIFHRIKQHYQAVGEQLRLEKRELPVIEGNLFIIPVAGMTKVVENSLHYVKSLHVEKVVAFYVAFDQVEAKAFEEKWAKWQPDVRLVTYYSPYRSITQPLMKFIDKVEHQYDKSGYQVTVVIPQFLPKKGWHHMLHNQSSLLIRAALLFHKNVVIMTVPYHLQK
ncbi:APC family permease [Lysinibacillus piscis]|uniref:Amino acid permease n=1 Tax=Lysinibacillus piscis TaxID=2518931 RepID=A0ABQ5NQX2_9BACI|nr:APC family permease [Lysinibacillus sp. KH24]GLC90532.1 amino acid permease [Lysinibacillus sp. KH24]